MALSCGSVSNPNKLLFSNDVESMVGWSDYSHTKAFSGHTGNYVCVLDSAFPYSVGFHRKVGAISTKDLLRVQFSAWVYTTLPEITGKLVCAVDSVSGKSFIYMAETMTIDPKLLGKWQKVTSVYYFPRNINKNFLFSAYLWNTGKEVFYADDLELKFTEY